MNKEQILKKLTSRKFLVSAAGIVSGVALVISGSEVEGVAAIIASVLGYLVAEGYIDAKAVKAAAEKAEEAANTNTDKTDAPSENVMKNINVDGIIESAIEETIGELAGKTK